jgi:hypothetical protein
MDDVPEPLRSKLLNAPLDDSAREYAMAAAVLHHYLGREFADRYIFKKATSHPFILTNAEAGSTTAFIHMFRVMSLADAVFALRAAPGFDYLLARLRSRELRAAYFEARTAASFTHYGFNVSIKVPANLRGSDFDFEARRDETHINVEVTEATNDTFSYRTLDNKLREKRSQVPADHPAVIYCIVPAGWHYQTGDIDFALMKAAFDYFGTTKRINAVVFEWDVQTAVSSGNISTVHMAAFAHPSPRHRIALDFLFAPSPMLGATGSAAASAKDRAKVFDELMSASEIAPNSLSFVRWAARQPA